MGRLSGKTAIITGASAGFGRGTAYAFAAEGCNLVLTARREERLQEAVKNAIRSAQKLFIMREMRERKKRRLKQSDLRLKPLEELTSS